MRIFKNIWFTRFTGKEGISDTELREAVNQLETGKTDASLGGNVYKVRIARTGKGKSGGYRVIVLFRSGDKTFYVYGFAKSERGNISEKELRNFKERANDYFSLTNEQLENRIKQGKLIEL